MKLLKKIICLGLMAASAMILSPGPADIKILAEEESPVVVQRTENYAYFFGDPDGYIRPNDPISRCETATLFCRILSENVEKESREVRFSDVNDEQWFYQSLVTLYQTGLLNGYDDGTFRPEDNITRAEFAQIIAAIVQKEATTQQSRDVNLGDKPVSEIVSFQDVAEDHWAYDAICTVAQKDWISGYPDGTFHPDKAITRAEAITIINRLLGRKITEPEAGFDASEIQDLPSTHWAYRDILHAMTGGYYTEVPVFLYHEIISDNDTYSSSDEIKESDFEEQMRYLAEHGYTTLLASEYFDYLDRGMMPPENTVIITFDDGYENVYNLALPIMKKYQIKANFAVIVYPTECISTVPNGDGGSAHHLNYTQIDLMTRSGLAEFGSHTYDGHALQRNADGQYKRNFMKDTIYLPQEGRMETTEEAKARVRKDLAMSIDIIERNTICDVTFFAHPYGVYTETSKQLVKEAGFDGAFSTVAKNANILSDRYAIPRHTIKNQTTMEEFVEIVTKNS